MLVQNVGGQGVERGGQGWGGGVGQSTKPNRADCKRQTGHMQLCTLGGLQAGCK